MMTILALIAGIAIGYFFKPQIDKLLKKAVKYIKDKRQQETDEKDDTEF